MSRLQVFPRELQVELASYLKSYFHQAEENVPRVRLLYYFAEHGLIDIFKEITNPGKHLPMLIRSDNRKSIEYAFWLALTPQACLSPTCIYSPTIPYKIYRDYGEQDWVKLPSVESMVIAGNVDLVTYKVCTDRELTTVAVKAAIEYKKLEMLYAVYRAWVNLPELETISESYSPEDAENLIFLFHKRGANLSKVADMLLPLLPEVALPLVLRGYTFTHEQLHVLVGSQDESVFDLITSLDYTFKECCLLAHPDNLHLVQRLVPFLKDFDAQKIVSESKLSPKVSAWICEFFGLSEAHRVRVSLREQLDRVDRGHYPGRDKIIADLPRTADMMLSLISAGVEVPDLRIFYKMLGPEEKRLVIAMLKVEHLEKLLGV